MRYFLPAFLAILISATPVKAQVGEALLGAGLGIQLYNAYQDRQASQDAMEQGTPLPRDASVAERRVHDMLWGKPQASTPSPAPKFDGHAMTEEFERCGLGCQETRLYINSLMLSVTPPPYVDMVPSSFTNPYPYGFGR